MKEILSILERFRDKEIVIIGDLMLDTYFKGEVTRVSVEAPIPIVKIEQEFHVLGGAGNVAANIISLGGKAALFSFVGKDQQAAIVEQLLTEKGVEFFLQEDKKTIQKIRVIGNEQQLARADFEVVHEKLFNIENQKKLMQKAQQAAAIIISDYAKGVITSQLMNLLSPFRNKIIVDPKPKNKNLYEGVFLIKPNEKELGEMINISEVEAAAKKLREDLGANILVTRGKKGMMLVANNQVTLVPANPREVFDVTGAGDTAIAAIALSIASGASLNEAALIANHAAGIKIEKAGTYAVSLSEIAADLVKEGSKIVDIENLQKIVGDLKKKRKKVVWTNGCFDLLHVGHTRYLKEAKKLGDILVVGLNSDESVKKIKGPTRPIQTERERAEILSSLEFVDYVIIFPEETAERYLATFQPHIYVKGGNYSIERLLTLIEGKTVKTYGGEIKIIPLIEGKSMSTLIEKIEKNK